MGTQAAIVWDEGFTGYNFGVEHPMNPVRLDLTARLCEAFGLFDSEARILSPEAAGDEALARVHDPAYIDAVRRASANPIDAEEVFGLGTTDDPAFEGIHEVSARIVEGSRAAAELVWSGEVAHGVNFTGGLHHAMPRTASGFCVYNDAAVAIDWLLRNGAERVAYVDVDAHHGDGVERIFWNDPRVLTVSIHETGTVLFPGTGFPGDVGGPEAAGTAVNISLPPGAADVHWLRAIHAVVPAVVRAFRPQFLVSQHGADSHYTDPLAHLSISVDAQRLAAATMHDLAHEVCDGRWLALGGGGYSVIEVVPRTWTHLTAIAMHRPVSVEAPIPRTWLDHVLDRFGEQGPELMGDGTSEKGRIWFKSWESGFNPEISVDRSIMATREAIFPHLGLDVWYD